MIKIKNQKQIDGIKKSCNRLSEVISIIKKQIEPGISTIELDNLAQDLIQKEKAIPAFLGYQGFPNALCISVNDEVIHGIPGKRIIQDGDLVSIDLGMILDGYFSDCAVSKVAGSSDNTKDKLMEGTERCLYAGIEAINKSCRLNDLSAAIESVADQYNLGIITQFCGHGVGIDLHEDPQIPNYVGRGPNPRLKPGMIIAIEPMMTLGSGEVTILDDDWTVVSVDHSLAAHFEHTVLVTENGAEILTNYNL